MNAERNDGFDATVSARALNIRLPTAGSLAHDGTRPHLYRPSSRWTATGPSSDPAPASAAASGTSATARIDRVGGTFQLGRASGSTSGPSWASKMRAR